MKEITTLNCPNCGATTQIDENFNDVKCPYCSTTILIEDLLDPNGKNKDNTALINAISNYAQKFYINKNFSKASYYYSKVLKLNPNDYNAYYYMKIGNLDLDNLDISLVKEALLGTKDLILKSQVPDSNNKLDYFINNIYEMTDNRRKYYLNFFKIYQYIGTPGRKKNIKTKI